MLKNVVVIGTEAKNSGRKKSFDKKLSGEKTFRVAFMTQLFISFILNPFHQRKGFCCHL
jgi:hypothetical protein